MRRLQLPVCLNPDSFEYAVIEVNPRVSRSSALASKPRGIPSPRSPPKSPWLHLDEIKNDVTGETYACFEPSVDYVVVKFPKWPFDKFHGASRKLGSQMKATGEVMSIADTFEMALMKAVRGAEISLDTLNLPKFAAESEENLCTSPPTPPTSGCSPCTSCSSGGDRGENAPGDHDRLLVPLQADEPFKLRAGACQGPAHRRAVHPGKQLGYPDAPSPGSPAAR